MSARRENARFQYSKIVPLLPVLLEVLYQDEWLIAVNKPHGLLVHRTRIADDADVFALQLLRDQIGRPVYPTHRLDRKTAGVLLFALDKETEIGMQQQFMNKQVTKKYWAIVRGYTPDAGEIDYPLRRDDGILQDAFTAYRTLKRAELPVAFGKHSTSRYSLIEAAPTTGRMHQLRKHFKHIFHPIIGDTTHGCNKQNKLFKEQWQMDTMLLHAAELNFTHPKTAESVTIKAPLQTMFLEVMQLMGW